MRAAGWKAWRRCLHIQAHSVCQRGDERGRGTAGRPGSSVRIQGISRKKCWQWSAGRHDGIGDDSYRKQHCWESSHMRDWISWREWKTAQFLAGACVEAHSLVGSFCSKDELLLRINALHLRHMCLCVCERERTREREGPCESVHVSIRLGRLLGSVSSVLLRR